MSSPHQPAVIGHGAQRDPDRLLDVPLLLKALRRPLNVKNKTPPVHARRGC